MTRFGTPSASLAAVDTTLAVAAGGTWVDGSSFDCKHGTDDLLAAYVAAQFKSTNAGSTNGQDLEVIVQFSDDNTNWPDDGQGHPIYAYADSTAGADLTLSRLCEFAPSLRYARFQYRNNNATDAVSVSSEVAKFYQEDNS